MKTCKEYLFSAARSTGYNVVAFDANLKTGFACKSEKNNDFFVFITYQAPTSGHCVLGTLSKPENIKEI